MQWRCHGGQQVLPAEVAWRAPEESCDHAELRKGVDLNECCFLNAHSKNLVPSHPLPDQVASKCFLFRFRCRHPKFVDTGF